MIGALVLASVMAAAAPDAPPVDAAAPAAAGVEARVRRYAVVIGVNAPAKASQRPLRFADDDAVRFYDLFRQLAGEAVLFSVLDDETQRLYPEVVAEAELPDKKLVFERIDRMFERIRTDRAQGFKTELYLIYSGHGYVDENGEGRLGLSGATFSRSELYDQVLARSPAGTNHLIVDACDAYFFVQSRGDDAAIEAKLQARAREFLDRQTLTRFPNTGAILSTASAAETHEWSEIKAGVFSHEVRSALLGAADADQSGTVSYDEIEAFVRAANAGVRHAGMSRAVFVRPPEKDRAQSVMDLAALPRAHRLTLPDEVAGRIALADERGRRYLDLHKAPGFSVAVRLLPGAQYFLRLEEVEYRVPSGQTEVFFTQLSAEAPSTAARGSGIADAYSRGLFSVPFGPALLHGFRLGIESERVLVPVEREKSRFLFTAGVVAAAGAAVAGGLAAGSYVAGDGVFADYQEAVTARDIPRSVQLDGEVRDWDTRSSFALGAAIAFGTAAATMLLLDALGVEL